MRPGASTWLVIGDERILTWLSELRTPWLTTLMRAAGSLATAHVLMVMWWVALAILVLWRRWRHLFVWLGALLVVSHLTPSPRS